MTEHIQVVPDKCRACRRCEVACIAAHHGMSFKEAMKHRDELVSRVQVVKTEGFKTTVRCHQCPHAPCVNVCPTGALQQDEQGRIIMRVQYCVACKMCIAACPYGTITMETIGMPSVDGEDGETLAQRARREVAVRCDMCRAWRMDNGKRITACMEACPAHALSLVLADGTVVEVPKPEKKTVAPAAGEAGAAAAEAPKAEVPKAEVPKAETPKVETAAPEKPAEAPKVEIAVEQPKAEAASAVEPKAEAASTVEPKAEATPEIKAEEEPVPAETPKAEKAAQAKAEAAPDAKQELAAAEAKPAAPVKAARADESPKVEEAAKAASARTSASSAASKKPAAKGSKKTSKKSGKK